ncbi:hydrolase [Enterococcus florum]|uniref:Hydrolase n=1 Tax=Enterococcus florum TaxID=2480627 RepID=A0A4P5PH74_9ENTE|nr:alpha/beta hydrolase [Enterococcus florum]GCF92773.1 hydrolase [Enterococcus florum]
MKNEKRTAVMQDGSEIYYEKYGAGPALFLLHGNGGSGKYFSRQLNSFSKHFTVFVIDSRGHGRSTNTQKKISFQLMAEDLRTLMMKEQLEKADFLGFSDGANLAMVFACRYPAMVDHLILNAGNTDPSGVRSLPHFGSYIQYAIVWLGAFFDTGMRNFLPILRLLFRDIGVKKEDLERIAAPTLVIVGKHDVIKTEHSMYIARSIPNASFALVSGQGHMFARRNPKRFNQEVLQFLLEN